MISEIIHTCDIINDLKGQREALRALVQLNKRYDFYEKLKVSELQLKRIDLLINAAGIGSSQQEGFDEFDNSLSTEPPVELPQSSPRIIMGDIVEQYTRAPALVERNSMAKRTRHIISLDSEQDSPRSPPKELDPVATASSSAFSQEIRQLVEREQSSSPILQVQSRAIVFSEMSSPLLQPAPTNNVQVIIDPLSDDQHITPTKIKRPRPKSDFFDIEDGLTPPMKERNDIFDFDDDLTPPRKENRAEKIGSPLRNTKKTESGMRVNVVVSTPDSEPRILSIPCADGLLGTPKTISWLKREAENRYFELCNEKCSLKGLLEATDCTKPLLNGEALIRDILKNDQYVYGDHISEGYEWGRL